MLFAEISHGAIIGFATLAIIIVGFIGFAVYEWAITHDEMMAEDNRFIQHTHVREVELIHPYNWEEEVDNLINFDPFHGVKSNHPSDPGFTPKDA